MANELVKYMRSTKKELALKLDFEKTYYKVNWDLLDLVMDLKFEYR